MLERGTGPQNDLNTAQLHEITPEGIADRFSSPNVRIRVRAYFSVSGPISLSFWGVCGYLDWLVAI